jgi:hypothetical protein
MEDHKILFFVIYILCLLFNLSNGSNGEDKFIEKEITLSNSAQITLSIGNQKNKPFFISLFSPFIITFPAESGNNNRYNKTSGKYISKNIKSKIIGPSSKVVYFNFDIGKEIIKLNENVNDTVFDIGVIEGDNIQAPNYIAGIVGLIRGVENIDNFTSDYLFLEQLVNKKMISKKIVYISNYYKKNALLDKAKLMIGKFPEKVDEKNITKKDLPFCPFDNKNSTNFYDCQISGFYIDDKSGNKSNSTYIQINSSYHIIGRFEEGDLKESYFPIKLFEDFKKILVDQKGCIDKEFKIICNNSELVKNLTISLVINNYKFILNPITTWGEDGTLMLIFNRDDDLGIIMSKLLGNFHRIYDSEDNKTYFIPVDNNIIKITKEKENEKPRNTIIIISIVGGIILILVILIIISYAVLRKNKSELDIDVNKISFQDENKHEENDDNLLLENDD